MGWRDYHKRTAMKISEELKLTEEQEREVQAMALWQERHVLTDEQLIWTVEAFPEFFDIKHEVFDIKNFESYFKL